MATPIPKDKAIPKPFTAPLPIDKGTITKAKGRVQGKTIMVSPAAKLNKYHPKPTGDAGPKKKNQIKPKIISAKIPIAIKAKVVLSD